MKTEQLTLQEAVFELGFYSKSELYSLLKSKGIVNVKDAGKLRCKTCHIAQLLQEMTTKPIFIDGFRAYSSKDESCILPVAVKEVVRELDKELSKAE